MRFGASCVALLGLTAVAAQVVTLRDDTAFEAEVTELHRLASRRI